MIDLHLTRDQNFNLIGQHKIASKQYLGGEVTTYYAHMYFTDDTRQRNAGLISTIKLHQVGCNAKLKPKREQ